MELANAFNQEEREVYGGPDILIINFVVFGAPG